MSKQPISGTVVVTKASKKKLGESVARPGRAQHPDTEGSFRLLERLPPLSGGPHHTLSWQSLLCLETDDQACLHLYTYRKT